MVDQAEVHRICFGSSRHVAKLTPILAGAMTAWSASWQLFDGQNVGKYECVISKDVGDGPFLRARLGDGIIWISCDDRALANLLGSAVDGEVFSSIRKPLVGDVRGYVFAALEKFGEILASGLQLPLSTWDTVNEVLLPAAYRSRIRFRCGTVSGYISPDVFSEPPAASQLPLINVSELFTHYSINLDVLLVDVRLGFRELLSLSEGLVIDTDIKVGSPMMLCYQGRKFSLDCNLGRKIDRRAVTLINKFRAANIMEKKQVFDLELDEVKGANVSSSPININMEILHGMDVSLDVKIGSVTLSAARVFSFKTGDVVVLEQCLNEPVDVLFKDKVVATGMLVAAGDNYGVEITSVAALDMGMES